jgi:type-F conjugative transfer system pilin assembly protein TrbC
MEEKIMLCLLIPLLLSINTNSLAIADLDSLKEAIKKLEEETAKQKDYVTRLVAIAENNKVTPGPTDGKDGAIDKWLNDYKQIKTEGKSLKAKDGFYIFVSFSLPKTLLKNLDKAAKKIGAKLVIRGLKDNSFKETLKHIKGIKHEGITIDIDPESFRQFGITHVPSFIVSQGTKYDKLVGNTSIGYVLNRCAEEGQTTLLSKEYLRRFKNYA